MKITKEFLKKNDACSEAVNWGKHLIGKKDIEVLNELIKADKLNWANWLIIRVMDKEQRIQYAIYAAKQVLHIFEEKYPQDDRPRKAIEAAKEYLKNPTEENIAAADAADAAADAAHAAADAACAAYAAHAEMLKKILLNGIKILGK